MYIFCNNVTHETISHRGSWYIPESIKEAVLKGEDCACISTYSGTVKKLGIVKSEYWDVEDYVGSVAEIKISDLLKGKTIIVG